MCVTATAPVRSPMVSAIRSLPYRAVIRSTSTTIRLDLLPNRRVTRPWLYPALVPMSARVDLVAALGDELGARIEQPTCGQRRTLLLAILFVAASGLPEGARVVEIGSYHGRSAIVLALGLGGRGQVVAIDPHAGNDRGPQEIEGERSEGQADHERFNANLARAGVEDAVRHVRLPSQEALDEVEGEVDLLYVDGAHRFRPALDDLQRWGARVRPGGLMLVHDSFSSIGVTLATFRSLGLSGSFRYEGRAASLARYRREELGLADRLRNAGRLLAQLPWFGRNVLIKVAAVLRLRDAEWPY